MITPAFFPVLAVLGNVTTGDPGQTVGKLNKILTDCGVAVGGIMIMIAIIKFIMSIADENAAEHQKASFMLGIGVIFISISAVLKTLGVENLGSTITPNVVAKNIITVICSIAKWAGFLYVLLSILRHILALASENVDENSKASKGLIIGTGLLSASSLGSKISTSILANTNDPKTYANHATSWLASVIMLGGVYFAVTGIFKFVDGLKQEDAKERQTGSKLVIVAILLLSIKPVLGLFGYTIG